ncbi:MAG: enoyl-[acyl-carrier-protein] reductase (NADH), partial [Crocinitomicaceae bacterium]
NSVAGYMFDGWAVGNRRHISALSFVRLVRFVVEVFHRAGSLVSFVFFAVEVAALQ